jgi:WD40 repeat protein
VSSDNKYLASGDENKLIYVWDAATMTRIHVFRGHRDVISGLVFRKGTHTLYSCSFDRQEGDNRVLVHWCFVLYLNWSNLQRSLANSFPRLNHFFFTQRNKTGDIFASSVPEMSVRGIKCALSCHGTYRFLLNKQQ